jgi:DNA mismatch endonuclease (patch repair protein)
MPDVFTKAKRSEVMARIRAKDTKPELAVRSALHRLGYRFRLHDSRLPGRPEIVLKKHHLIIEVKGCFWHSHRCLRGRLPVENSAYWSAKLANNARRDRVKTRRWRALGWRVATVWECDVRRLPPDRLAFRLSRLFGRLTPGRSLC